MASFCFRKDARESLFLVGALKAYTWEIIRKVGKSDNFREFIVLYLRKGDLPKYADDNQQLTCKEEKTLDVSNFFTQKKNIKFLNQRI